MTTALRRDVAWALALAVWFALMTAAGEIAERVISAFVGHRILFYGAQMAWKAPVAETSIFVPVALVALGAGTLVPRLGRRAAVVGMLSLLAWLSLLLPLPRLHWLALVLLAAGTALQTTRLLLHHFEGFRLVVRRTLPGLVGATLLAGGAVTAGFRFVERRTIAALPAPRVDAPNVLFLILDTVRAINLSAYGYARPTSPVLARVAGHGVLFERAIAPASYTLASHASFFTGHWPHELGVDWVTPLDHRFPTLAETMARAGYRTAGFSANEPYVTRPFGLSRGFAHFEGYPTNLGDVIRNATLARIAVTSDVGRRLFHFDDLLGRKHAEQVNDAVLGWLGRSGSRPYFVFANYFDAHAPYLPQPPCDTAFGWYDARTSRAERRRRRASARREPHRLGPVAARALQPAYDGAIACLDASIGRLLRALEQRGLLANTLVVIASDHGEEFGEHGVFDHGNSLYLPSLHVPLIMAFPGRLPEGRRVRTTVSLRDIPATILDIAGVQARMPGRSLRPLWGDTVPAAFAPSPALSEIPYASGLPDWYPVSRGDMASVVTERWQYIRDGAGHEEVFDLARDPEGAIAAMPTPEELNNLRALSPPTGPRRE